MPVADSEGLVDEGFTHKSSFAKAGWEVFAETGEWFSVNAHSSIFSGGRVGSMLTKFPKSVSGSGGIRGHVRDRLGLGLG